MEKSFFNIFIDYAREKFEVQIYMKASTKTKAEFSKIFFCILLFSKRLHLNFHY